MENVAIIGAVRTPIGKFGGSLGTVSPVVLGATVIREVLKRFKVTSTVVDEVVMGNILSAGQGMNPARQASVKAGVPVDVPAMTINKMCGSGLKAVALAAQAIKAGDLETVVAGGIESMSRAPYLLPNARFGYRMGDAEIVDSMISDGLYDCMIDCHMGVTAEELSDNYSITRGEADMYALQSQEKALNAKESGRFADEIIPVNVTLSNGSQSVVDIDEHPRTTSFEKLSGLKPAFQRLGVITAGNSAGINDGAAAILVMAEAKANKLALKPMAFVRSYASAALEPRMMGVAPVQAIKKALAKAELELQDIGLVEINEAFAAQVLAVGKEIPLDPEITNVNGGAIALGHPIGASGARILTTLLYEMTRRQTRYGLATLCIGGGQGIAMVLELP